MAHLAAAAACAVLCHAHQLVLYLMRWKGLEAVTWERDVGGSGGRCSSGPAAAEYHGGHNQHFLVPLSSSRVVVVAHDYGAAADVSAATAAP